MCTPYDNRARGTPKVALSRAAQRNVFALLIFAWSDRPRLAADRIKGFQFAAAPPGG
jgi:hypothetical protein